MPQELPQPQTQLVSNPSFWDVEEPDVITTKRSYTVTDTSDPLNLEEEASPPSTVPEAEASTEAQQEVEKAVESVVEGEDKVEDQSKEPEKEETTEKVEEEEVAEDVVKHRETFINDLDYALKEKTGVDLAGITEALVELLTWRNDILSLSAKQQPEEPTTTTVQKGEISKPPSFQRSSSKTGELNPAERSYDFKYSTILNMAKNDPAEYDRNSQRITEAFMNNRVLMDV